MKKKSPIFVLLAMVFMLLFISPSAWAESPRQYRWEGFAIGAGAAILGCALINSCIHYCPSPRVLYRYPCPLKYGYYHPPRHYRGHWKARKRLHFRHYKETRCGGYDRGHGGYKPRR